MEIVLDGIVAFFCAIGIATVVWWLADWVLYHPPCPMPYVRLVLQVEGAAPTLHQDLRTLWRLRKQLPYATIVVEDHGLTPDARMEAEALCALHKLTEVE
ncbi:hypothetical protein RFF05_15155 [Bengtsoniella intestinalis]|uniref:hypothetical protein n=1 Tax=Bengtsoniella intestinalis TaxID=3073143 RepID=UPI00391EE619